MQQLLWLRIFATVCSYVNPHNHTPHGSRDRRRLICKNAKEICLAEEDGDSWARDISKGYTGTYIYYLYRKMLLLVIKTLIYIFYRCRGIILKVLYASPKEPVFFRVSSTIHYL
jgi:hypothetical protein